MSAPIRVECDICDQQIGRHPLQGISIINLYDGKEQKYYCYDDINNFLHSGIIFLAENFSTFNLLCISLISVDRFGLII